MLEAETHSEARPAFARHDYYAAVRARVQQARRDAATQRRRSEEDRRQAVAMRALAAETWNRIDASMRRRQSATQRADA